MRQLDASDCDGRVLERLEPGHRFAASLDRAMVLLNEVIQILVRPHFNIAPARVLTSQQPQRGVRIMNHIPLIERLAEAALAIGVTTASVVVFQFALLVG
jgi:hypothetical protein